MVHHNKKPMFEVKLTEMRSALTTEILEQAYVPKVIETVRHHMKEAKLPDVNIVCLLLDVIMDVVQWSRKNSSKMLILNYTKSGL